MLLGKTCCTNNFHTKVLVVLFIILKSSIIFAQKAQKFNAKEAADMIALCNSYTYQELYGDDAEIIPEGYLRYYQSEPVGMDNMYQIYIKDTIGVVNFRGSTAELVSWWENFQAAMIPASGEIRGDLGTLTYDFAITEGATVHSGYSLGLVFLSLDILPQLDSLKTKGVKQIIITGHSQGGALANLFFALLNTDTDCDICDQFSYRVYAFAAPMVGNDVFCKEYNERYCKNHESYNILNVADPIPRLPFKFDDTISYDDVSGKSMEWAINNILPTKGYFLRKLSKKKYSYNKMLASLLKYQLKGYVTHELLFMSEFAAKQSAKHYDSDIQLPEFIKNIEFDYVDNVIKLSAFEYPKVLKDSSKLNNKRVHKKLTDNKETRSEKRYYKKGSWVYQHKPYNYYVHFLKEFQKPDYEGLEKKYLLENL